MQIGHLLHYAGQPRGLGCLCASCWESWRSGHSAEQPEAGRTMPVAPRAALGGMPESHEACL